MPSSPLSNDLEADVLEILQKWRWSGLLASDIHRLIHQEGLSWSGSEVVEILRALLVEGKIERGGFSDDTFSSYRYRLLDNNDNEECEIPL